MTLRPVVDADHAEVLALNAAHVELLSPLDEPRLRELLGWADQALVVELDGGTAGFVLTFASTSAYDGENFAWFREHLDGDFGYLDRIVLTERTRRRGVGTAVYDALELRAPVMCLEVNSDPPNEASLAFHAARGYQVLGHRGSHGHEVAMMSKDLRGD